VLLENATMAQNRTIARVNPDDVVPPKPTYSHVTTYSTSQPRKIISVAGQAGVGPEGALPSTLEEQVKVALENLRKCLECVGAGPQDVLKITHYVVGYDSKQREWTRHFVNFFQGDPPASTLVPGMFMETIRPCCVR
jgi:monoamine oxidase